MNGLAWVAAGGALGSIARHGLNVAVTRLATTGFPWGIVVINVLGCFVMGLVAAALLRLPLPDAVRLFLATGFLGGFTTFSAFALDTLRLVQAGQLGQAAFYVLVSVAVSLLAIFAGFGLMRIVLA